MASVASSLKGQAEDLVQTVAVFKLRGASGSVIKATVRSAESGTKKFKGSERRTIATAL
jgi:hypothetical protein